MFPPLLTIDLHAESPPPPPRFAGILTFRSRFSRAVERGRRQEKGSLVGSGALYPTFSAETLDKKWKNLGHTFWTICCALLYHQSTTALHHPPVGVRYTQEMHKKPHDSEGRCAMRYLKEPFRMRGILKRQASASFDHFTNFSLLVDCFQTE